MTLNLSRAAERLGVAQPTLSVSLSRLEAQLGTKLFRRKNKGLELSLSGDKLLRHCNRLMAEWDQIVSDTKKSQTELNGYFKLGCHSSVAIYSLNPALAEFYSRYEGIEFGLEHGLSRVICEQVISGKIDFGLVVNAVKHPDLHIKILAKDEVTFWKVSDGDKSTLIYNPQLLQSQSLMKKLKGYTFKRAITSDNLEVITSLASSGAGVAILPTRVAKTSAVKLDRVVDAPIYHDVISFIYKVDLEKTAAVKAIIDFFKNLKI